MPTNAQKRAAKRAKSLQARGETLTVKGQQALASTRPTRTSPLASRSERADIARTIPKAGGVPVPTGPTPLPQPEREQSRLDRIKRFGGPETVKDVGRLQEMLDAGDITREQFDVSKQRLESGFSGVNPLGFGNLRIAGTDGFDSLEDALKKADDEFRQFGSVSPETDAAIFNFQNPQVQQFSQLGGTKFAPDQRPSVKANERFTRGEDEQTRRRIENLETPTVSKSADDIQRVSAVNAARAQEKAALQQELFIKQQQETLTREEQMRLNSATSSFEDTASQVDSDISLFFEGIGDQSIVSAYQPLVNAALSRANIARQEFNRALQTIPSESNLEVDSQQRINILERSEGRSLALQDNLLELRKEIAETKKEALELDKKILEVKNDKLERNKLEQNIQEERRFRRQMNALGIETDTNGLDFLSRQIRNNEDDLDSLVQVNDLNELKLNLEIVKGYDLDLKDALFRYDEAYTRITNATDEKVDSILADLGTSKREREKNIRDAMSNYAKELNDADKEAAIAARDAKIFAEKKANQIKNDQIESEKIALKRIDFLLSNYQKDDVRDAVIKIGKDVKSFDVSVLLDNPTVDEINKVKSFSSLLSIGESANTLLPNNLQVDQEPEITLDEFINDKLFELESKASQSFNLDKRAKVMEENIEDWEDEYNSLYKTKSFASSEDDIRSRFGDNVLTAANLIIDGTYGGTNAIKNASKALGAQQSQVAMAVQSLRRNGKVVETETLSPQSLKNWNRIRSELKKDTFYSVWKGAISAKTRIETAIRTGGGEGIADIMAINAFQNGIVDPGATVREGDVELLQTAVAFAQKWGIWTEEGRKFWSEKLGKGAKMPDSMRNKMLELASATERAYGQDFVNKSLPQFKTLVRQSALPESILDEFLGSNNSINKGGIVVSPEVSNFVKNLPNLQ